METVQIATTATAHLLWRCDMPGRCLGCMAPAPKPPTSPGSCGSCGNGKRMISTAKKNRQSQKIHPLIWNDHPKNGELQVVQLCHRLCSSMFNLMILMFEDLAAAAWYLVCCWRLHPRGEQLHFGQIFLASLHRIYTLQRRFVVFLCSVHLHRNPTAIINKRNTQTML